MPEAAHGPHVGMIGCFDGNKASILDSDEAFRLRSNQNIRHVRREVKLENRQNDNKAGQLVGGPLRPKARPSETPTGWARLFFDFPSRTSQLLGYAIHRILHSRIHCFSPTNSRHPKPIMRSLGMARPGGPTTS